MSFAAGEGAWDEHRSYYGQPVIKEPVWSWEIPLYFYMGGLAGGSAGLAYLSELRGNPELARRAWAAAPCSPASRGVMWPRAGPASGVGRVASTISTSARCCRKRYSSRKSVSC